MNCPMCDAVLDESAFAVDCVNEDDDSIEVLFRCPDCDIALGSVELPWSEFHDIVEESSGDDTLSG